MMIVKVNGEEKHFEREMVLTDLLERLQFQKVEGIAVAVNYSVSPRTEFDKRIIRDGDEIEIIRAVQGG